MEHMILNHFAAIKNEKIHGSDDLQDTDQRTAGRDTDLLYRKWILQNMVRILTGTLIEIGDGRRTPEDVSEILEAKTGKEQDTRHRHAG